MAQQTIVQPYNSDMIEKISQAAQNHKMVRLVYRDSKGSRSVRRVEPYEIKDGGLFAHDPLKESIRFFKLSRIVKATPTTKDFTPRWPMKL